MKSIIIIGASSGIGRKVALDFAAMGWQVGIAARREDKLKEVAAQGQGRISFLAFDVTEPDAPSKLRELIAINGGCDVLLYASGVGFTNPQMDPVLDRRIVDVNVMGFTRIVNAAYQYFANAGHPGRIAAITSVGGTKGLGYAAAYSASKSYQQKYLQAIDQLARMQGVPVGITDIRPGFVRTDLIAPDAAYPLTMAVDYAAPLIEKAILRGRRVATIDWRWGIATALWRLIPDALWPRLPIRL